MEVGMAVKGEHEGSLVVTEIFLIVLMSISWL